MAGSPRALILTAALALALASSGCSLAFVTTAAPPRPRGCTTSRLAPTLDSAMAGYQTVRTALALSADNDIYERYGVPREADVAVGAALTALFLGSAVYGYVKTAECSRVRARYVAPGDTIFWNERLNRDALRCEIQRPSTQRRTPGPLRRDR